MDAIPSPSVEASVLIVYTPSVGPRGVCTTRRQVEIVRRTVAKRDYVPKKEVRVRELAATFPGNHFDMVFQDMPREDFMPLHSLEVPELCHGCEEWGCDEYTKRPGKVRYTSRREALEAAAKWNTNEMIGNSFARDWTWAIAIEIGQPLAMKNLVAQKLWFGFGYQVEHLVRPIRLVEPTEEEISHYATAAVE